MNSLPRCFLPASSWAEGQSVPIPPEETHHLIRVLRVEPGERVMVFDGAGREAEAEVESSGRLGLSVRLRQPVTHPHPAARVILFQAVLKGERMDDVVQKAVELGAAELVPLAADHSVVKLTAANAAHKLERWRAIALGAARQSGNPFLMEIREPVTAEASVAEAGGLELPLFGSLEPGARPLWDRLIDIRYRRGVRVGLWIGPEGDWSPAEYAALRRAGVKPVTLGPLVLRAETAAFYGLSVIGAGFTAGSATPAEP
jgi:16S rRNA (uracil1498-N3)-methyltransferase